MEEVGADEVAAPAATGNAAGEGPPAAQSPAAESAGNEDEVAAGDDDSEVLFEADARSEATGASPPRAPRPQGEQEQEQEQEDEKGADGARRDPARLEEEFVTGLSKSMLPLVAACDKHAYSVAASQDALLSRVKQLQETLAVFTDKETEAVPTLAESSRKLRETRARLAQVNSKLLATQSRLGNVVLRLHAGLQPDEAADAEGLTST